MRDIIEKSYQGIHNRFKRHAPSVLYDNAYRHRQILKYIVAGGISTCADLFIYYLLTYRAGLWYVGSAIFSFIIAFWISFDLQKFWTFRDKSRKNIIKQTYLYFIAAIFNLGISALLIYIFVDYIHIHKFVSKALASAIIAVESFFVYRFIFRTHLKNNRQ